MRFLLFIQILVGTYATGQSTEQTFIEYISQINHFSPMEGAGSHGSYGVKLGLGVQVTPSPYAEDPFSTLGPNSSRDNTADTVVPRVSLTKGLDIPINLGISYGALDNENTSQWAGYLQWTVFEKMAWPALAVRYSLSKVSGMKVAEVTSQAIEVVTSYGFLRYFTAFASMKWLYHDLTLHEESGSEHRLNDVIGAGGGLQLMILPPFTTATFEVQGQREGERSYYGKLAHLL